MASLERITVAQYHRMIEAGVFGPEERFELLGGRVVVWAKRSPLHDSILVQISQAIRDRLPTNWRARVLCGVTLSASECDPDLAVVPGPASRYRTAHPGPDDIALVVEVSDTTLARDRDIKGPIYARDALPVYWIVNLVDRCIEVYTDPTGPTAQPHYRHCRQALLSDTVDLIIGGQTVATIPVADLLT